jgi:hypothetical protein
MPHLRKCLLALLVAAVPGFSQSTPLASWVQLGVGGQIIARQVLNQGQACPQIVIPGSTVTMNVRGPSPAGFTDVTVCEGTIPASATSASINGVALPLPKASAPVAEVGDSGCEGNTLKTKSEAEPEEDEDDLAPPAAKSKKTTDCSKPENWPLAQIAATLASKKPGLVIHVGDYVYVKDETWQWWNSQFFEPSRRLLQSAAWLFVRGNHETCDRHGPGYFLLLDPRPYGATNTSAGCSDATAPYLVPFAGAQYVVLDSSGATCDFAGQPCSKNTTIPDRQDQIKTWTQLIQSADGSVPAGDSGVLLTHRAVWGAKAEVLKSGATGCSAPGGRELLALNSVLEAAWTQAAPKQLSRVISGHTHTFELLTYKNGHPPQLIAGNSGAKLTHPSAAKAENCNLATTDAGAPYVPVARVDGLDSWGYTILDSATDLTAFSPSGKQLLHCSIKKDSEAKCK